MTWGVNGVTVRFDSAVALDDVTLELAEGQITTVVGGDGAGKTTLARLLVGLVPPASGVVERPDRVGYQSATSGSWGDLSVVENLELVAAAYSLSHPEASARLNELVQLTRLEDARDRLAKDLSGGMRQKLGVAMAVLPKPELLILDEPTTGLDPVSRADLWRLVSRFVAEGMTVMATTTYVDEAERGSQVLALDAGTVLAVGAVDVVRRSMPGVVGRIPLDMPAAHRWRRGREWRAWFPDGRLPAGAEPAPTDLADVMTVAAFRRRAES